MRVAGVPSPYCVFGRTVTVYELPNNRPTKFAERSVVVMGVKSTPFCVSVTSYVTTVVDPPETSYGADHDTLRSFRLVGVAVRFCGADVGTGGGLIIKIPSAVP